VDRALEADPRARLVARPDPGHDVLRPHRRRPEDGGRPGRERAERGAREEQGIRVLQRCALALEVGLVAAVGLDAVDAERDQPAQARPVGLDDGRLREIEHPVVGGTDELPWRVAAALRQG
jgi:hypothetical protein